VVGPRPLLGDCLHEQGFPSCLVTIAFSNVHYKYAFGTELDGTRIRNFRNVRTIRLFPQFFYYGGHGPWTNDVLCNSTMPGGCGVVMLLLKQWGVR